MIPFDKYYLVNEIGNKAIWKPHSTFVKLLYRKEFSYVKGKNPKLTKRPIRNLRCEIIVANKHENKK